MLNQNEKEFTKLARKNKDIEQLFRESQVMIDIIEAHDVVKAALEDYGLNSDKINAFKSQHSTSVTKYELQLTKYGIRSNISMQFKQKKRELDETYSDHVSLAREVLEDAPDLLELLDLYGDRKSTLAGYFAQVKRFYTNALANDTAKTRLSAFGLTQERLEAGLQLAQETETANSQIHDAASDAEKSTRERNASVAALAKERRRILTVASVALKDQPELLDKLKG